MTDIAGNRNSGCYTIGRPDTIRCNRYAVSRFNDHYNGYIVGNGGLGDLRDIVLKPGTMNFVTNALVGGTTNVKTHII